MQKANGYKTYALCGLSILWGLYGMWKGFIPTDVGTQIISTALIGSGLRHSIANS